MSLPAVQSLQCFTRSIEAHRSRLLLVYAAHDLHQLRVNIRRVRALMKHVPELREHTLRFTWKPLFGATSNARDRDVLLVAAHELLPSQQAAEFEIVIQASTSKHHRQAIAMLESTAWHNHMQAWSSFLQSPVSGDHTLPAESLELARARAVSAGNLARSADDDRHWHRYRIAVKNLRYLAVALADLGQESRSLDGLITQCRLLQDLLGVWHDCNVQLACLRSREMINELAGARCGSEIGQSLIRAIQSRRHEKRVEMRAAKPIAHTRQSGFLESE